MTVVKHGIYYVCRLDPGGWRCGRCLRGFIGPVQTECAVCLAKVIRK